MRIMCMAQCLCIIIIRTNEMKYREGALFDLLCTSHVACTPLQDTEL